MENDSYIDGIHRGIREGRIVFQDPRTAPLGPEDVYSHIPAKGVGMTLCNSRPLPQTTRSAIDRAAHGLKRPVRVLELGHGSGTAIAAVRRQHGNAMLHTIGLTPVNPYWIPLGGRQDAVNLLLQVPKASLDENAWDPDAIMDLQRRGMARVFERSDTPFIDRQLIGYLERARRDQFAADGYDVMAEHSGALRYATHPDGGRTVPMHEKLRICELVYDLLGPQGVFVTDNLHMLNIQLLRRVMKKSDEMFRIRFGSVSKVLMGKADSMLGAFVRYLQPHEIQRL